MQLPNSIVGKIVLLTAVVICIIGIAFITQFTFVAMSVTAVGMLVFMYMLNRNSISYLFFFVVLLTEFFYISVLGGNARPYHFLLVLVFLFSIRYMSRLVTVKQFWMLLTVYIYLLMSSLISLDVAEALKSYTLLMLNVGISLVTALILCSEKISMSTLKKIIFIISLVGIIWGLIQFGLKTTININLSLSETQVKQIEWNLIPAFRTEADSFSKYLSFPLMLFIPYLLRGRGSKKVIIVFYVLALLCIGINMVRTGIYGLMFGLFVVLLFNFKKRKVKRFIVGIGIISVIAVIILFLVYKGILPIGDYARSKIVSVFNFSSLSIKNDYSGSYRIKNIEFLLRQVFSNTHNTWFGMGWGQAYYYYGGKYMHLVIGDLFSYLGYGGIIGLLLYLIMSFRTFLIFKRAASLNIPSSLPSFAEGMMYAFSAVFFTSILSGQLIAPEYWVIIGAALFTEWEMGKYITLKR